MKNIGNFTAGERQFSGDTIEIANPATAEIVGRASLADAAAVAHAVASAKEALTDWSSLGLQSRSAVMLDLREAVRAARSELVSLIVEEAGKTKGDAGAEVDRAIEALGQAASIATLYGSRYSPHVSKGVDTYEARYPIGVIAAISPFNFPVLIPVVQFATAIAAGNTVILKPSERDPSATLRLAELLHEAGLPSGVLNAVVGDRTTVDTLVNHPDIAGVSFVGSSAVASAIREAGVRAKKRVQAFGSGKNHIVVMPDADLDIAADAAVSGAFGAAGQRCMAVSVVVAVGDVGDRLVAKISDRMNGLKVGDPANEATDMGPVISVESQRRIEGYLSKAREEGAIVRNAPDRNPPSERGWFVQPSVLDHVKPGSAAHTDEIFGPVLSVTRVNTYDEALRVIGSHSLGNGASIFTNDGGLARRFVDEAEVGQLGINVPIPFPVFFHGFGGWKESSFTETKLFGPDALAFCTRSKTVTSRWPTAAGSRMNFGFPMPE